MSLILERLAEPEQFENQKHKERATGTKQERIGHKPLGKRARTRTGSDDWKPEQSRQASHEDRELGRQRGRRRGR